MIRTILMAIGCFYSMAIFSQIDKTKQREVIVSTINPLRGIDMVEMKFERKNEKFLRIQVSDLSIKYDKHLPTVSNSFPTSTSEFIFNALFGFEKRIEVAKGLELFRGPDFSAGAYYANNDANDPSIPVPERVTQYRGISFGSGYHIGIQSIIRDRLQIGLVYQPHFTFASSFIPESLNYLFDLNYGINAVKLQVGLRWHKSVK